MTDESASEIRSALGSWFATNRRDLPWRQSKDPYQIWLSEIILQQTRVEQGLPYFDRFLTRFPTVESLASANIDDVLIVWEGLGYYSRARNLHKAATQIVQERDGALPVTFDDWLKLPGVGPYTAAAVSSIAHGEARAVVDGNVIRVLSRLVALDTEVGTAQGKREISALADALLDRSSPGLHNEALMELGALVCIPRQPDCSSCPFQDSCLAYSTDRMHEFPRKKRKPKVPHYDISVGIIRDGRDRVFIQRRADEAMLGGLWEFPGGKNEKGESLEETCVREIREEIGVDVIVTEHIASLDQAYSHFKISLHAYACEAIGDLLPVSSLQTAWVTREELAGYAFPRANRRLFDLVEIPSSGTLDSGSEYQSQRQD